MKLQDHHQFSKLDHRSRSLRIESEGMVGHGSAVRLAGTRPRQAGPGCQLGNFRRPQMRRITRPATKADLLQLAEQWKVVAAERNGEVGKSAVCPTSAAVHAPEGR